MRRFLRDAGAFLLLQLLLFAALDAAYMRYAGRGHYLASFLDKSRHLEATRSPRIVLVGGSSIAFGVDSAALERESGRPVVNLGLNAGLGLRFLLAQAAAAGRPADLVVLSPEYHLLLKGEPVDSGTLLLLLRIAPDSARFVPPSKIPQLLDQALDTVTQRCRTMWSVLRGTHRERPYYLRDAFDERGDVTAHLRFEQRQGGDQHVYVPTPAEAEPACVLLTAFGRRAREQGVHIVIVPPPIPADDYATQQERVVALWDQVQDRSGLPVADTQGHYGRDMFLDTPYHLTSAGRLAHSRAIVRALRSDRAAMPVTGMLDGR